MNKCILTIFRKFLLFAFFFIHKVIKQIHVEEAFTNPAELRNRITRTNHKISCKTK